MQTGPGHLFVGSTQHFLRDGLPTFLRCNHSVQYKAAQGLQPPLVQHLRASAISSAFDPKAEALHFQLTTALQAGEAPSLGLHAPLLPLNPHRGPQMHLAKSQGDAPPPAPTDRGPETRDWDSSPPCPFTSHVSLLPSKLPYAQQWLFRPLLFKPPRAFSWAPW